MRESNISSTKPKKKRASFRRGESLAERYWSRVDRRGPDECWGWKASLHCMGYGQMFAPGTSKLVRAHRVSWEIHNGPIPEGMQVLHRCDNRECSNPAHLFLGTHQDNMADKTAKGRQAKGTGLPQTKITEQTALEIRRLCIAGAGSREIATQLGVTVSIVNNLRYGLSWCHLGPPIPTLREIKARASTQEAA